MKGSTMCLIDRVSENILKRDGKVTSRKTVSVNMTVKTAQKTSLPGQHGSFLKAIMMVAANSHVTLCRDLTRCLAQLVSSTMS